MKTAIDGSKEPRTIGLAVMEITGFKEGSKLHASLVSAKLCDSGIKVVGQLLELKQTVVIGEDPGDDSAWEWTGQFLKLDTSAKDPVITRRQLVVDVPGSLVFPLQADVIEREHLPVANGRVVLPITWELTSGLLEDMCTEAWSALSPGKAELVGNLSTLPIISNPSFPYKNRAGMRKLHSLESRIH